MTKQNQFCFLTSWSFEIQIYELQSYEGLLLLKLRFLPIRNLLCLKSVDMIVMVDPFSMYNYHLMTKKHYKVGFFFYFHWNYSRLKKKDFPNSFFTAMKRGLLKHDQRAPKLFAKLSVKIIERLKKKVNFRIFSSRIIIYNLFCFLMRT